MREHVYSVAVTFKMTELQKSFKDDAMSGAQINVWHKLFKDD